MKKILPAGLIIIVSVLLLAHLPAQEILDPQVLAQQAQQQKSAEESGYADIAIDNLHRELAEILPVIAMKYELDAKTNEIRIPVAFGESIHSISERYIYEGDAYLGTDKEGKSLTSVRFVFVRANALGVEARREQREMRNPTPNFSPDNQNIDRNDDLVVTLFYEDADGKFQQQEQLTIAKIPFFDKKIRLLETYKKYLRRSLNSLKKEAKDIKLSQRVKIQNMLDFY